MDKYQLFLFIVSITSAYAPRPAQNKQYREDYIYNRKTDAFYKFHAEQKRGYDVKDICIAEGAQLMVPTSHEDMIQVHAMFKKFPDIGPHAFVDQDGKQHESAEEAPLIDYDSEEIEESRERHHWLGPPKCDVITRDASIETVPCYRSLPFVCKVEAKDAPYDSHCGVYGRDYLYYAESGSCYKIPRIVYSWNGAYSECRVEGAHLAVINSEAEHMALINLTNTMPKVIGAKTSWFFFAGFRADRTNETLTSGHFRTVFNQTLEEAGFSKWSPNEPNNSGGVEFCGTIFKNDGLLNDVACEHQYAFICEKEVPRAEENAA